MKLAIIQPYFFPYIGYFQLVKAVDKFVFYDDVQYITRGWINRNKILINNEAHYLTINVKNASQNKRINQIVLIDRREKHIQKVYLAYKKAPNFGSAWPVIESVLNYQTDAISELAAFSVIKTCNYLGIKTNFEFSSQHYADTLKLGREERIIEICKRNHIAEYVNPIGGIELYERKTFADHGISLRFLSPNQLHYRQFGKTFWPNLSIIDVMMFNDLRTIKEMLNQYNCE